MTESHPLVELARKTIEAYVKDGQQIDPPEVLTAEMQRQAGVFVTIRRHGKLRGCIGTIHPTHDNVAEEVQQLQDYLEALQEVKGGRSQG